MEEKGLRGGEAEFRGKGKLGGERKRNAGSNVFIENIHKVGQKALT